MAAGRSSFALILFLAIAVVWVSLSDCRSQQYATRITSEDGLNGLKMDRRPVDPQVADWEASMKKNEQLYKEFAERYEELEQMVGRTGHKSSRELLDRIAANLTNTMGLLNKTRHLIDRVKMLKEFGGFLDTLHAAILRTIFKRDDIQDIKSQGSDLSEVEVIQHEYDRAIEAYSEIKNKWMEKFAKDRPDELDASNKSEFFITWVCWMFGLHNVSIIPPESMEAVTDASGNPILVGKGGNGEVRLMRMKSDGEIYAVKTQYWHLNNIAAAMNFLNEVRTLRELKGLENFPALVGITSSEHGGHYPAVVQEFIGEVTPYGAETMSLGKALSTPDISEMQSLEVAKDVSGALQGMHNRNVIHRDLKADNIMLRYSCDEGVGSTCENSGGTITVILVDFGTAINLDEPEEYIQIRSASQLAEILQFSPHIAPDIVMGLSPYSKASDVYSFGYVLYELGGAGDEFLLYIGDECMDSDPAKRPTVQHISALLDFWTRIKPSRPKK